MEKNISNQRSAGIFYGALSYTVWGLLPLYWKLLSAVAPLEILANRVLWSFVFVTVLIICKKRLRDLAAVFRNRRTLFYVFLSSIFIALNWFIYIWAVNSGHIVESSMGYYINPLMSVLLGMAVLKERLSPYQYAALFLAAVGVINMTVQYGKVPWVSLALAVTFALYGLFKKLVSADSMVGLTVETAILTPAALAYILARQIQGIGAIGTMTPLVTILLLCAGVATATPLLWFGMGAKRLDLSTLGFLQYISPTISLILGVFIYKEHFTQAHRVSFGFIWAALIIFSLANTRFGKREKQVALSE